MMKLAFTTLGCPDWDLPTIIARAKEYGYDGIDFRGLQGVMNIYELPEFSTELERTKRMIRESGLEVSCFSSSVQLFSREKLEQNLREIEQFSRLCREFETRYIRVFGGGIGETKREEAVATVCAHLEQMSGIAGEYGVKLLLETHDDWTSCADVKAVMERLGQDKAAVLWDVHHPYRMLDEQPEATWQAIGPRIEYTHWKDSTRRDADSRDYSYCLMGQGDIPLAEIFTLLKKNGYDGWFTLEWEKKWHPEIEEPEIALPQYVEYMRYLLSRTI
jgi:sugar phosphate isomerase/epimerase